MNLKKNALAQIEAVQRILRRWDPIGVRPGIEAPVDEYDGYAPHIVSLVVHGCSVDELSNHLGGIHNKAMGLKGSDKHDNEIASEIIDALHTSTE